jgi:hypothetical protein
VAEGCGETGDSITRNVTLDSQADLVRLLESCRARCLYTKAFPALGVTKFDQLQDGETYYFDAPLVKAMAVAQAVEKHAAKDDGKPQIQKEKPQNKFFDFSEWIIN